MLYNKENEELMKALRHGDMEKLKEIGPDVVRKDAGNYAYSRALNSEVVYFLIECGVEPQLGDKGETPFFHCRADKVESLIAAGYDVNHRAPEMFGELALIAATYANDTEKVTALINCGADVRLANRYGRNAMCFAKTPEMRLILQQAEMKYHYEKSVLAQVQETESKKLNNPSHSNGLYKVTSFKLPQLNHFSRQNVG